MSCETPISRSSDLHPPLWRACRRWCRPTSPSSFRNTSLSHLPGRMPADLSPLSRRLGSFQQPRIPPSTNILRSLLHLAVHAACDLDTILQLHQLSPLRPPFPPPRITSSAPPNQASALKPLESLVARLLLRSESGRCPRGWHGSLSLHRDPPRPHLLLHHGRRPERPIRRPLRPARRHGPAASPTPKSASASPSPSPRPSP